MLMDIKCSAVTSIKVDLTFDNHRRKVRVLGVGDLVSVDYNANGLRKHVDGTIINISATTADPNGWYIIVDGSDDFDSNKVRFSPMSILDVEIIRKADQLNIIKTPIGHEGVPYLRIVKGRLQYSKDGFDWHPIRLDSKDIIEDAEGTVPVHNGCHDHHPSGCGCDDPEISDNTSVDTTDGIEDANY